MLDEKKQHSTEEGGQQVESIDGPGGMIVLRPGGEHHKQPECHRSGHGGDLKHTAVEGDGAGELRPRHQTRDERGAGGPKEGARPAHHKQEKINPAERGRQNRGKRQSQARGREDERGGQNNFFAVMRVCKVSGGKRKENHGQHLRQADECERQGGTGALIKLPINRYHQHLLAEGGNKTANQIPHKVRVTKNFV